MLRTRSPIGASAVAVAVACSMVLAACGGGKKAEKPAPTTQSTEARAQAAVATAPLTGLPDPRGVARHRPVITVKINNTDAEAQSGIDQADVVYEEVVESGITRLAAMFNSHDPDRVGPVRSVRRTDQSLVWPVGGVFVYSGGAQYAIDSIDTAPVTQLDETRAGSMMFRDPTDPAYAPYNLWAHVDQMFKAETAAKPIPPRPLFTYRKPHEKVAGTKVGSFIVGFQGGFATTWTWDAKHGTWLRTTKDPAAPDVDAEGVRIAPQNVVVLFVDYAGGVGVEGSEAQLTGTGTAWVFTDGHVIKGHWSRTDKRKPDKLTNDAGKVIALTPGQTWVELPDVSYPVLVAPPA